MQTIIALNIHSSRVGGEQESSKTNKPARVFLMERDQGSCAVSPHFQQLYKGLTLITTLKGSIISQRMMTTKGGVFRGSKQLF